MLHHASHGLLLRCGWLDGVAVIWLALDSCTFTTCNGFCDCKVFVSRTVSYIHFALFLVYFSSVQTAPCVYLAIPPQPPRKRNHRGVSRHVAAAQARRIMSTRTRKARDRLALEGQKEASAGTLEASNEQVSHGSSSFRV